MVKVQHFLDWLNAFAPFDSAEGFDNVGLLMGDPNAEVCTVLFGMDITEALAKEAVELGAELIITHHPFIFRGIKRIDYTGPQGRVMALLMQHGISVIAAHTNYDKAPGGISDALAKVLGLQDIVHADDYVRVGTLPYPMTASQLNTHVRELLHIEPRCYPASDELITRAAVAGGAYGEGYEAALAAGAQAFVVGEIGYHEVFDAAARGLTVLDAGHYPTERPGVAALYGRFLADADGWSVKAYLHDKAPFAGAILALQ